MKIKKYEAETEQEALDMAIEELGREAVILNTKTVYPKGLMRFFGRPVIELTAAYDEDKYGFTEQKAAVGMSSGAAVRESAYDNAARESAKENIEDERARILGALDERLQKAKAEKERAQSPGERRKRRARREYKNAIINKVYRAMLRQGVLPEVVEKVFSDIEKLDELVDVEPPRVIKYLYNSIRDMLGEPNLIQPGVPGAPAYAAFIGPTGVGKTTTVAKISAEFMLNRDVPIGLITADTYRVAAVEQLRTYADILDIDVKVVYGPEDMRQSADSLRAGNSVVLVDTAGRSHRHTENMAELKELINKIPEAKLYLVLSLSTKFEDLCSIVKAYSKDFDFSIIFTKMDETHSYGSILNLVYLSGKRVSYLTNGQNVPDDLMILKPDVAAKALLGLGDKNNE